MNTRQKTMIVSALILVFMVSWSGSAFAQTVVSGGNLTSSTTWSAANSPYVLEGDFTIASGVTLTIDPGVIVQVRGSDTQLSGTDSARVELIVEGGIDVNGTASNSVKFVPDTGLPEPSDDREHWWGIDVRASATQADFDHFELHYAKQGLQTAADSSVTAGVISHSFLVGLAVTGGTASVDGTTIRHSEYYGVQVAQGGELELRNALVHDNGEYGIDITFGPSSSHNHVIDQVTVHDNTDTGIFIDSHLSGAGDQLAITNSIVAENLGRGLHRYGDFGAVDVSYTNVWENTQEQFLGTFNQGAGNDSTNPLFANPPQDYALTSRSPGRNSGDLGQDRGARAYAAVATPELTGHLWQDMTMTAANSPYTIFGDLTVPPGRTLTIEAGAVVEFAKTDQMKANSDDNRIELIVEGAIDVNGTWQQPVQMVSFNPSSGLAGYQDWAGMEIRSMATRADIDHLELHNATQGLISAAAGSVTEINGGRFSQNLSQAIAVRGGTLTIEGARISSIDGEGVRADTGGRLVMRNTIVSNVNSTAVRISLTAGSSVDHQIVNSNIYDCDGVGIYVESEDPNTAARATIINTNVTNNSSFGIRHFNTGGVVDVSYSNVFANGFGDYQGTINQGAGNLSSAPGYVSPPSDFSLAPSSPVIDAGTSTGAPAVDIEGNARPVNGDGSGGKEFDIGAYEFGASSVCGDGSVEAGETCDDGNTDDGDGCSATCTQEGGDDAGLGDAGTDAGMGDAGTDAGMGDASMGDAGVGDIGSDIGDAGDDAELGDAGEDASMGDLGVGDIGSDIDGGDADAGPEDAGSRTGDAGSDIGGGDTPPETESDGCGCASASSGPKPAAGLYLLLVAFGIGATRRRRIYPN